MPSDQPNKLHKNDRSEAGLRAWSKLRQALICERRELQKIRAEQGLEAARQEQDRRLAGLADVNLIEQMLIEGCLSYPNAVQLIEKIREMYYALITPLPSEDEEQLQELTQIRKHLIAALWEVQYQVEQSLMNQTPCVITLDLESAHKVLKEYQELPSVSSAVSRLMGEITTLLKDLDQLVRQFSG